jgi:putative transposase
LTEAGGLYAFVDSIRCIVERTFGWFNRYRRLRIDFELPPTTGYAMIQVTMIHLMIRRLARVAPY